MSDELKNTQSDELSWLALRYVGGEMTSDEAAAFEARLSTNQAACEAVSIAVQTVCSARAVFESESVESAPARSRHTKSVPVTVVATRGPAKSARWISFAVSVLAMVLVLSVASFHELNQTRLSSDAARNRELAVLWTEAGRAPHLEEIQLPPILENDDSPSVPGEDRLAPVDLVAGVPEWMLVALENQRGEVGNDDETLEN